MIRILLLVAVLAWPAAAQTVLRVGMGSQDAGPLDPHRTASTPDIVLLNWVFNGLVRFAPGTMDVDRIEPDLAERWDRSEDGLTWTFHLRPGLRCHGDHGALTAEDVAYSLRRAADPKRSIFASDYTAFRSIEAVDPATVRIALASPVPGFLALLVNYHGGAVVCRAAAEAMGDGFSRHPVGTGPFMFGSYSAGRSVTLLANPAYFRGPPRLGQIVFNYIPSDASRDLAFIAGEIDLSYGRTEQPWIDRMAKVPGVIVDVADPSELGLLIPNVTVPPLNDLRVRQAIAYAVSRPEMVRFKGAAAAKEARSVVPIGYLGMTDEVALLPHDLEKAKTLLREAGYPNGFAIRSIVTNLSNGLSLMQVIQAQLRRAGITLELDVVEHATYHEKIRQDLSPIVYYSAARIPVAGIYLAQFFHSRSIVGRPAAVTNFSHCTSADAAIDAAAVEPDPARQKQLWHQAQQTLMAEVCAIPLIEVPRVWVRRATLDYGHQWQGSLSNGPQIDETSHFKP